MEKVQTLLNYSQCIEGTCANQLNPLGTAGLCGTRHRVAHLLARGNDLEPQAETWAQLIWDWRQKKEKTIN